jgi:hypothetical protein
MDAIERAAEELINRPIPSDEEAVDMAGRLAYVIGKLNAYKRALLAEVSGPVTGSQYRTVTGRKASRSYNTASILSRFDAAGVSLHDLRAADAVRLNWRWSELKKTAYDSGVTLSIAPREIEDDGDVEAPMVGEVWTEDVRIEGVK